MPRPSAAISAHFTMVLLGIFAPTPTKKGDYLANHHGVFSHFTKTPSKRSDFFEIHHGDLAYFAISTVKTAEKWSFYHGTFRRFHHYTVKSGDYSVFYHGTFGHLDDYIAYFIIAQKRRHVTTWSQARHGYSKKWRFYCKN